MQPGHRTPQHDKARAGQTRSALEVDAAQRLTDLDMVTRFEIQLRRLAGALDLDIVLLARTVGHGLGRDVRQIEYQMVERGTDLLQFGLTLPQLLGDCGHLRLQRLDVLTGGLGLADRLRASVAQIAQFFDTRLDRFASRLQRRELLHIEVIAAPRQAARDALEIVSQQLGIEHCRNSSAQLKGYRKMTLASRSGPVESMWTGASTSASIRSR